MSAGKNALFVVVGGVALVGLAAIGFISTQPNGSVGTSAVQGAIGQRDVYRDSSATGAAVDANSSKETDSLYVIGRFKALADDPQYKEIVASPDFVKLVQSADFQAVFANENFQKLAKNNELASVQNWSAEFERRRNFSGELAKTQN